MSTKKTHIKIKKLKKKFKNFWENYEEKIVLSVGMVLITSISFQMGILQGQKWQQKPLIIEKTNGQVCGTFSKKTNLKENIVNESVNNIVLKKNKSNEKEILGEKKNCVFVGSKNSNKYHKIGCRFAKRIKPENIVCFKNKEDAKEKGYIPAHCIK